MMIKLHDRNIPDTVEAMQWEENMYQFFSSDQNAKALGTHPHLFHPYSLDADLVSIFLCSAVNHNQPHMVCALLDLAESRNILLRPKDLVSAFNCAITRNSTEIMNIFNSRTSVVKDSLQHLSYTDYIMRGGVIDTYETLRQQIANSQPYRHYSKVREARDYHNQNVLLFGVMRNLTPSIGYLLDTGYPIHPQVLAQSAFRAALDKKFDNFQLLTTHPSTHSLIERCFDDIQKIVDQSPPCLVLNPKVIELLEVYQLKKDLNQEITSKTLHDSKTHKI